MSDDWQYTEEPAPDLHALCCRRCERSRGLLIDMAAALRKNGHRCWLEASYKLPVRQGPFGPIQDGEPEGYTQEDCPTCSLLARFAALNTDPEVTA